MANINKIYLTLPIICYNNGKQQGVASINKVLIMGLQFEVESLDGIDEGIQSLYSEHEGKFRLQVEGIDPADELKAALKKERELSKMSKAQLKALEDSQRERDEQVASEKGEFKTLWEKEQAAKRELQEKLSNFQKSSIEKDKNIKTVEVIAALTKDEAKTEALRGIVNQYISSDEDGNVSYVKDGVEMQKSALVDVLKEKYPFLVDGSKASGGDASGNSGAGSDAKLIPREQFDLMTQAQRAKFTNSGGRPI